LIRNYWSRFSFVKGFHRLALLIGARCDNRTSGYGLCDGGTRFLGCCYLLSGGGFFRLFFLFDFKLVLFPLLFGGLLLCRPVSGGFLGGKHFLQLPVNGLCLPVGAGFSFRLFALPPGFFYLRRIIRSSRRLGLALRSRRNGRSGSSRGNLIRDYWSRLGVAQCLQGFVLIIVPACGGLPGCESRPAYAGTTG
jgi:hypothetical protein